METSNKPYIVASIPALDEERTIAKVVINAMKYVDKVIVVDDGSSDMTGEIAERLGAEVIRHERNLGYGASLASLFKRACEISPDIMVTLDADSQHDPNEIPRLVEPILKEEADIVVGSRFLAGEDKAEMPKYRKTGIKAITKLAKAASYSEITDAQSGLRAYNRKALQLIVPTEQGMGASTEILIKAKEAGLKIKEVPVRVNYQVKKRLKLNPFYHGLDVVLSTVKHMSVRHPLVFYGIPGFIALVVATIFWVWTLRTFAATRQVITNIALIAIGATIVGLTLVTTAMILWVLVSILRERVR